MSLSSDGTALMGLAGLPIIVALLLPELRELCLRVVLLALLLVISEPKTIVEDDEDAGELQGGEFPRPESASPEL